MSVASHLDFLNRKYEQLEREIKYAFSHHYPDQDVAKLKRQRLSVAEEMERCRQEHAA